MTRARVETTKRSERQTAMTWYRYETGPWWRHTRNMSDAEKGKFADALNAALEDRRMGVNPIADEILREAETFSEKRRAAAKSRWAAPQKNGCHSRSS